MTRWGPVFLICLLCLGTAGAALRLEDRAGDACTVYNEEDCALLVPFPASDAVDILAFEIDQPTPDALRITVFVTDVAARDDSMAVPGVAPGMTDIGLQWKVYAPNGTMMAIDALLFRHEEDQWSARIGQCTDCTRDGVSFYTGSFPELATAAVSEDRVASSISATFPRDPLGLSDDGTVLTQFVGYAEIAPERATDWTPDDALQGENNTHTDTFTLEGPPPDDEAAQRGVANETREPAPTPQASPESEPTTRTNASMPEPTQNEGSARPASKDSPAPATSIAALALLLLSSYLKLGRRR